MLSLATEGPMTNSSGSSVENVMLEVTPPTMILNNSTGIVTRKYIRLPNASMFNRNSETSDLTDFGEAGMPDPELLIRTSGEQRISNYLLWQLSYAELYVTEVLWPEFKQENFFKESL